ncbi:GDSL esterase/lipase At5g45910 [Medicago truncatula]|uniref:GDSL esterase/lipase At5g45910 n=1 Tax=Medicago truncatula TaxID=3880 RepID=UPI001966D456|nr:GDSL esterase/lipase At5g45910-like [Medicago truncatula]
MGCFFGVSNSNHLPYDAIFNFGDSISDTGNQASFYTVPGNSSYGSTYFKQPSGRFSDGRLIIDFIAEAYGLPFLPAYKTLTKGQDVTKGVNFAFAGSTALNYNNYLNKSRILVPASNYSLGVQLKMFKEFRNSTCKSKKDCRSYFKKSLFLVGEIGGNDLSSHISQNFSNFRNVVPLVVAAITKATTTLIKEGAVEIVVPGNFPIGCGASLLALATGYGNKTENYDEFGCFKAFNTMAEYFNDKLIYSINTLRENYPNVKIIYFDYYNAAKRLYEAPEQYGFDKSKTLKACCGGPNTTVCSDPSKYINWDGPHLTEAAYRQIAKGLVEGPFANPPLKPASFKIA